ncbi:MAG: Ubiquinone biosynthesis O-methyltransferase [Candidatus Argoarchaeum ethanivorans]|uniref:Ubiquinone biosynthesis O-methyltransferase n=1 Tax=Candidatus Argoarchaeum ethanivorans TaxID=2608793 RepID=A0A811T5L3_9EURY|nr:MAG: Ubiquinone biosynthesis O-methyltransferase [Candidatus Argoarchaeum ethanivorans]
MKPQKGVLSVEYHEGRERKLALKYRLARRTDEVLKAIKGYKSDIDSLSLLDIGTADGLMLNKLCQELNIKMPVGLDFSAELLKTNPHHTSHFVQADACELPFDDGVFDVVVATAVIEHVPEPEKMVTECHRVLRQDGICIFTTPDPFFEHIATKIGHLKEEQHQKTFKLPELKSLFELQGFKILKAEKFMMSPIGFPYEVKIERFMKTTGLGFLLLNQLVVGYKRT